MSMPGDPAGVDLVEAGQERGDGRLARARRTDEGDGLPRANVEVDPGQDRLARAIPEADILVADVAAQPGDGRRAARVDDVRLGVEQLRVAAEAGDPLRVDLQHGVDLLHRPEEDADEEEEADEAPLAQLVVQHQIGPGDHHDELRDAHAEVAERHAGGHQAVGLQLRLPVARVVAGEEAALVVLVGEGLHHPHAADILLDAGVELADPPEERAPGAGHAAAIADGDPARDRQNRAGDQRQGWVDPDHQREGAKEGHDRDEEVFRAMMGDLADLLQVLRHPRHQMPRLLIVVEAEGELLQMVEAAAAHLGLDVDAELVAPVVDDDHQGRIEEVDAEQRGGSNEDKPPVLPRQEAIDEEPDRHREAELEQAGEDRTGEIEREEPAMGPVVGEKAADERGVIGGDGGHGLQWREERFPYRAILHDSPPPARRCLPATQNPRHAHRVRHVPSRRKRGLACFLPISRPPWLAAPGQYKFPYQYGCKLLPNAVFWHDTNERR
jgi:hypothetical protein